MDQELEIEFKNMLTKAEYTNILEKEFSFPSEHMITQTNYYFDTIDSQLKQQKSALRIRVTDSYHELTLKVPSQGFLMETNIPLSKEDVSTILKNHQLKLSSYIHSISKSHLMHITEDTDFHLFNSITTNRLEKNDGMHLIVLDETLFQNNQTDYELEIESEDEKLGEKYFNKFLEKYSIPSRPSISKIARAEQKQRK